MVERKAVIQNPTGLTVQPAGVLCREAMRFPCRVMIVKDGTEANAKSMLSVLGAMVRFREEITLVCDGPQEEEALTACIAAIEAGLGEL